MSEPAVKLAGVWDWSYDGGTFEVNFLADGHFVCKSYPEHSTWSRSGSTVKVEWGHYGSYDMKVSDDGKSMEGAYRGYPDDWRKATFKRAHTEAEIVQLKKGGCGHDHSHG